MKHFTERKFLTLPARQQHKKCAEMLREVDEGKREVGEYETMAAWMGLEKLHEGREALAERYHAHLCEADVSLKEHRLLIEHGDREQPLAPPLPIDLYLDNIRSAHNVGSIIRTVEGLGLGTVVMGGMTPTPDRKQVRDAAMGCERWVTWKQGTLEQLEKPIIAIEVDENATALWDYSFPEKGTLVVGNEETGCSQEVLEHADAVIAIPMTGRKFSLNVANALAIVAAEVRRQDRLRNQP